MQTHECGVDQRRDQRGVQPVVAREPGQQPIRDALGHADYPNRHARRYVRQQVVRLVVARQPVQHVERVPQVELCVREGERG